MLTKSFILSSKGLKNLVKDEKEFTFFFGDKKLCLNNLFAEFISPLVSHIHYSDPTINSIQIKSPINSNLSHLTDLFSEDIIKFIYDLSNGSPIEINVEQSTKIQLISILLGNEELFHQTSHLFQNKFDLSDIELYIEYLYVFNSLSNLQITFNFNISSIIDLISSNFNLIEKDKLLKLPEPIIFSIISNDQLKLENEDSLLDFILQYFSGNEEKVTQSFVTFLEKVIIENLSEEKFREFIISVNPNYITNGLWSNLCKRFLNNDSTSNSDENRYAKSKGKYLKFDGKSENRFNGIIRLLTNECGGNVHDKGVVKVTESSANSDDIRALNLVDLDNFTSRFLSENEKNSWAQYDFVDRKVCPTHYSIRSRPYSKREYHLKGWVIEGSNTGSNDWTILDSRSGETCLDGKSASSTFKIQHKNNEFYRYLRIRQTELNAANNNYMGLSALEYFGYII